MALVVSIGLTLVYPTVILAQGTLVPPGARPPGSTAEHDALQAEFAAQHDQILNLIWALQTGIDNLSLGVVKSGIPPTWDKMLDSTKGMLMGAIPIGLLVSWMGKEFLTMRPG